MVSINKILVPVDFSDCSRRALEHAAGLAEAVGATIEVLYVWEPPVYAMPDLAIDVPGEPSRNLRDYAQSQAVEEMGVFLQRALGEAGAAKVQTTIESGHVYRSIVDLAARDKVDLIVMGTHGRTGLPHIMLGSIAEKVVRHASCPVLTIRGGKDPH